MGLALQFSNIPHYLIAILHRLMPQPPPTHIPGLFTGSDYSVETPAWHDILRENANSCKLTRIEFCKAKGENLHEFLILYFSHPTHTVARAVAMVERAAKDRSQSSVIASPSIPCRKATEALDRVHIMAQGDSIQTYLDNICDPYDKLCILEYPLAGSDHNSPQPPSAMQLSTLLLVATNHQPQYNLYEYNCYWYADTIFEACKSLFPGCQEDCIKHGDRGRCRFNVPMLATHTLSDVCNEYNVEWEKVTQRFKANQEIITQQEWERRLDEERRVHEASQQEWVLKVEEEKRAREAVQQEWVRKLDEERRTREAAQQELECMLEVERKAYEAAQAAQQELVRKLAEVERRYEELQATRKA